MGSLRGKRVLVTGGLGFIGSNLVDALVGRGAKVTVLDDLFTGQESNTSFQKEVDFVEASVTDKVIIGYYVEHNDIIFHLAARSISLSTQDPRQDYETTLGGVLNVLLAMRKYGVDRLVFSSSASVYGNAQSFPIREDAPLMALSPYAASKIAAEAYCMAFHQCYDLPVTILRYSNVYGPGQNPKNPGVISKFLSTAMRGESLKIYGDGGQTRDYTYIDDVVVATLLSAVCSEANGEIINIAGGKETSVYQIAEMSMEIVGGVQKEPELIEGRDIDNLYRRVLSIEKAQKILQWSPVVSIKEGLGKTQEWLRERMGFSC